MDAVVQINPGQIRTNAPMDPYRLPVQSISSLMRAQATATNDAQVRVQGTVLDQRLGEYIVIRGDSGTLFAETQLAVVAKVNERVDLWGVPVWDGSRVYLKNAAFRSADSGVPPTKEIAAAAVKPAKLPLLTKAWEVRDLSPERAAWHYPVRLRGVVTVCTPQRAGFIVQDDISGIYISMNKGRPALKTGDLVEIEGASDPGAYAPVVAASNVTVVGTAPLPEACPVTLFQLATGQEGSQWIEVRGVVRSLSCADGLAQLELSDPSGMLTVNIPAATEPTNLLDAVVRIHGACGSVFNDRRQLTGFRIWVPSLDYVQIEEPGVADPFSLPLRPIVSLSQYRPRVNLQRRINVAGVVTLCLPAAQGLAQAGQPGQSFFLQDAGDGIQVFTSQTGEVKPGDRVMAAGYPAFGDYGSVLRAAVVRVLEHGPVPAPKPLAPKQALDPQLHGMWVQIDARLLHRSRVGPVEMLTLQIPGWVFDAHCLAPEADTGAAPAGSLLHLTGVYCVLADEARSPTAFHLLVPSGKNIQVLEQPSWWTFRHTMMTVGIMAIIVAATILWIFLLGRQVREQTRRLRERLEREAALEQQYREIFEGANDLIFTHDIQGRFTSLNAAALRVLGYSAEEAKQLTIDQVLAPEYHDHGRQLRETTLPAGEVVNCQGAFITKDGRRVMIEVSLRMAFRDGKPVAVHGIARDITERKRAEAALHESQALYHSLVEHLPINIYRKDREGRFVFVNSRFCQFLGKPAEQILGRTVFDLLPKDLAEQFTREEQMIMRTGKAIEQEEERQDLGETGRYFHVVKSPVSNSEGATIGIQGMFYDITERKRVEERYRTIIAAALDGFWLLDMQGHFLDVNDAYCNLIGYSREELLSMSIPDIEAVENPEETAARVRKIMEVGGDRFETHHRCKDGRIVDIEVSVNYLKEEERMSVFLRDITERKQAGKVQEATFRISQAVNTARNLDDLYREIHSVLAQLMPADNFYIALYDPTTDILSFPYRVDQYEPVVPARKPDRSLTEYVLRTGNPLFGTREVVDELIAKEEVVLRGVPSAEWLGVPLKIGERTLGVMAVQSYTENVRFGQRDLDILRFVSTQVAIAIEHKRAEAALAEASSLLETLLDNSPDAIYFKDRQSRFVHFTKSFSRLFNVPDADVLKGKTDFDFFTEEHARQAYEDEQEIIRSGKPIIGKLEKETHADGRLTWALTNKMPWRDKDGNIIGTFGISKDATVLKEAEDKLAYERELLRSLLDNVPDHIYFKDHESRFVRFSKAFEKLFKVADAEQLRGKTDFDFFTEDHARPAYEDEQEIIRTGQPIIGKLEKETHPDGRITWCLTTKMPWRDQEGNIIGTFGISKDITGLKQAEAELETTHKRLVEVSRMAGMAEVATDVLHNVGNVLTSVNVSCSLAIDRVQQHDFANLAKIPQLLQENAGRLDEFLTTDPKGRHIPEYLAAIAQTFDEQKEFLQGELNRLRQHIDHIKQIVTMQQNYARVAGVEETVEVAQLVDDALHINAAALDRHTVQLRREMEPVPPILVDKHRVLQILVNLIRNAKYALSDSDRQDKLLTVRVDGNGGDHVQIQVTDNGVGIAPENLTRIFAHGFTTRGDGHGFGLHSGALAARDLGGSLSAHSDGLGKGATFTLLVPIKPPPRT